MATSGTPAIALRLTRTYPHAPDKVFQAWTEAQALTQWLAPTDEYKTVVKSLDLRRGGSYRIEMHPHKGDVHVVVGKYLEIERPLKLSFTWKWEQPDAEDTVITITLRAEGQGTEMTLVHEKFDSAESRDKHEQGWNGCFERLEKLLVPVTR